MKEIARPTGVVVLNKDIMATYGIQGGNHTFITFQGDGADILDMLLMPEEEDGPRAFYYSDTPSREAKLKRQWGELTLRLAFIGINKWQ